MRASNHPIAAPSYQCTACTAIIIFPTLVSHCQKKELNCSPKTNEGLGTLQECKCPQILLITFKKADGTNKVTSVSAGVNTGRPPSGRRRVFSSFIEHFLMRNRHGEMLPILFPFSASCFARRNSLCATTSCPQSYQDGQTCTVSFNHSVWVKAYKALRTDVLSTFAICYVVFSNGKMTFKKKINSTSPWLVMVQGDERWSSLHIKCRSEVRPVLAKYTHGAISFVRPAVPFNTLFKITLAVLSDLCY